MTNSISSESDSTSISSWPWYLLCLSIPLTSVTFVANIRPYELVVMVIFLYALTVKSDARYRVFTQLDYAVITYALYQVIVVFVGAENIYESARAYRYLVLGPVLLYAVIRMLPFSIMIVKRAHIILIAVVLIQSLFVFYIFFTTGRRPGGFPNEFVGILSKFAFTISYVATYLFFSWKISGSGKKRMIILLALIIAVAGFVGVASRGVTVPTFTMLLLMPFLWKKRYRRKVLSFAISIFLVTLIVLIALSPPKFDYDESEVLDDRRSLERIVSVQDYLMDAGGRISFWSGMFDIAMNKPLFGHGAASFEISRVSEYEETSRGHHPTHSHNVLISSVITGGLVGLVIMLWLITSMLNILPKFSTKFSAIEPFEKSLISWSVVFVVVGITNDIAGGLVIPFFFMMGLMQQIQLYGYISDNVSDTGGGNRVSKDDVSIRSSSELNYIPKQNSKLLHGPQRKLISHGNIIK